MIPLTGWSAAFVWAAVAMILVMPRRWAPVPLLIGTFYLPLGLGIQVGTYSLFAIRMLILAGFVRVIFRREGLSRGLIGLDKLMIVWALWAIFSSVFHPDSAAALKFNMGMVFNACGCYFLLRVFCTSIEDAVRLCAILVMLLVPVAVEMYAEQQTVYNSFSLLGGGHAFPQIREGRVRAQGPFAHAILAGTVGAVSLPLAIALWSSHRKIALAGIAACITIILTSASSGPAMSGVLASGALLMWPLRHHMRSARWIGLFAWMAFSLSMQAPFYYLLARIDVAGGSTGWYRARLIESSIEHLNEWWLGGTDKTSHWMPTRLDSMHADITNQYVHMGVTGGVVLIILFVLILVAGFRYVGMQMKNSPEDPSAEGVNSFFVWALGASLFAHATTFISVAYFDQSFVTLYLTLALIATIAPRGSPAQQETPTSIPSPARDASAPPEVNFMTKAER